MKIIYNSNIKSLLLLIALLICFGVTSADAQGLILNYEQVSRDQFGNEIGYRTYTLNSPDQLPLGSPWRDYLNIRMSDGKTIYQYALETSQHMGKPLRLTLSDRNSVSYTSKGRNSHDIYLFDYVNNLSTDASKRFLFLHEFGHAVMLNSYPSNYDFNNLDYGGKSQHYIDDIFPNHNTAWVEGWANAFAAQRNDGMIFSIDLNNSNSMAFLSNNSFDEMSRNQLFVAKTVYDSMKQIDSGRGKVFDAFSRTAPHYSLADFFRGFTSLYPENRVDVARILYENSHGKISLNEMLHYVNNGSRTVSQELYNFLAQKGMVSPQPGHVAQPPPQPEPSGGFFGRIFGWISRLFSRDREPAIATAPAVPSSEAPPGAALPPSIRPSTNAQAPQETHFETPPADASEDDLNKSFAQAKEDYYKAFMEYNRKMANNSDTQLIRSAGEKLQRARQKVEKIRKMLTEQQRK